MIGERNFSICENIHISKVFLGIRHGNLKRIINVYTVKLNNKCIHGKTFAFNIFFASTKYRIKERQNSPFRYIAFNIFSASPKYRIK